MTLEQLGNLLESVPGFSGRVAYRSFPVGEAPGLPFVCYLQTGANTMPADDRIYYSTPTVDVELYTALKFPETETQIEAALATAGIVWTRDPDEWLSSERCFMIVYHLTL